MNYSQGAKKPDTEREGGKNIKGNPKKRRAFVPGVETTAINVEHINMRNGFGGFFRTIRALA